MFVLLHALLSLFRISGVTGQPAGQLIRKGHAVAGSAAKDSL